MTENKIKIAVVVPARNEEKHLEATLKSLINQTTPIKLIVIDDGSTDVTSWIALTYADKVISLPPHEESYIGTDKLADVFNYGIKEAISMTDFTMISGADCVYSKDYIEKLLHEFELNPKLAIASGVIGTEPDFTKFPRGAGRIVRNSFWKSAGGIYPYSYGFESCLLYKALDDGWEIKSYPNIIFSARVTKKNNRKMYAMGKAHRAMNVWWVNLINSTRRIFFKNPLHALYYLYGYITGTRGYYTDLSVYNKERLKETHPIWARMLIWSE